MTFSPLLIKALALILATSQILIGHDVKVAFDAHNEQQLAIQDLQQGCAQIRKTLEEDIPAMRDFDPGSYLDVMIKNAQQLNQSQELMKGIYMADAKALYEFICNGQMSTTIEPTVVEMLSYYNSVLHDLPDPAVLVGYQLPEFSSVWDASGNHLTDLYNGSRRQFVPLASIPELVQKAVLSAEDKNFYQHHGVDPHGIIRAGYSIFTHNKKEQGGSTITQQVVKNLLVGNKHDYERKLREMVLANQLERVLSKPKILEIYLNFVFFGRSSWGVKQAAFSWFNKPLERLSPAEAAFLAGMPKGPSAFNPQLHPKESLDRTLVVLKQMKDNGVIDQVRYDAAVTEASKFAFAEYRPPVATSARYFTDELSVAIKKQLGIDPNLEATKIQSTLHPNLQTEIEGDLQEGLAQYELRGGNRAHFSGAEGNLSVQISAVPQGGSSPAWQVALSQKEPPLPDVHWPLAVIYQLDGKAGPRVGLSDGRTFTLKIWDGGARKSLKLFDLVYVHIDGPDQASLRHRPDVEGAVMVMENKTGRIVAMTGGFSHSINQLNRAVHALRQPGSTVKPMTYLAALNAGLQPNTLIADANDDPVNCLLKTGTECWWPNNERAASGRTVSLRQGLERSMNRVTARILTVFDSAPEEGLKQIFKLMSECGIADNLKNNWSYIIGTMDVPMINMVTCFATIANEGYRPSPRFYESVEKKGHVYKPPTGLQQVKSADAAAFYQLKTLMQGVLVRGTATEVGKSLSDVAKRFGGDSIGEFIGAKTGTTQRAMDAWLIGYTNDLTIAVWVGYDNASVQTRKILGGGEATGAAVAGPIWAQVLRATLGEYPLTRLRAPSAEAAVKLVPVQVATSGKVAASGGITDYMRVDSSGEAIDTREKFYTEYVAPPPDEYQQAYSPPATYTPSPPTNNPWRPSYSSGGQFTYGRRY